MNRYLEKIAAKMNSNEKRFIREDLREEHQFEDRGYIDPKHAKRSWHTYLSKYHRKAYKTKKRHHLVNIVRKMKGADKGMTNRALSVMHRIRAMRVK